MYEHKIVDAPERKLVGQKIRMSLVNNRTPELWRSFMPRKMEIKNAIGKVLFSVQVNERLPDFKNFDPSVSFDKWAAVEVISLEQIPADMDSLILPAGRYAVFHYKGASSQGEKIFRYIYTEWLPASGFALDLRPQFEILGEKYKNDHPDSEEEIWIPIK